MKKLFLVLLSFGFAVCASEEKAETDSDLYDYELFKAVQRMREYAEESGEKHLRRWGAEIASGKKGWPSPFEIYDYVTKRGAFLVDDEFLITPWGRVELSGSRSSGPVYGAVWAWRVFRQDLLRHCKITFLGIDKRAGCFFGEQKPRHYYVLRDRTTDFEEVARQEFVDYDKIFREISEEELKEMQGQDVIAETNLCGFSAYYALHEVDGQELPIPERLDCKSLRNHKAVSAAWKALTKRYETEKACRE